MQKLREFPLIGMSKPESFTCENGAGTFLARNGMGKGNFDNLWEYCEGHWDDNKIALVEYDGFSVGGDPINPTVIAIKEAD